MVGGVIGLGLGVSPGCYFQDEEFVDDFAVEVCQIIRECGGTLTLPGQTEPLLADGGCEGQVEAHFLTCGDRCEYQPHKARRCLRRLRRDPCSPPATASGNDIEIEIPLVCNEVYASCEGDDVRACRASSSCAVAGADRSSELGWALGLVALGMLGRRRRRLRAPVGR